MRRAVALTALLLATSAATAQNSTPQPLPFDNRIPIAKDVAYPGTMTVKVDATDVQQAIYRVKQTIPVEAGAHIAEIIKIMLEKKASGTDLKL